MSMPSQCSSVETPHCVGCDASKNSPGFVRKNGVARVVMADGYWGPNRLGNISANWAY